MHVNYLISIIIPTFHTAYLVIFCRCFIVGRPGTVDKTSNILIFYSHFLQVKHSDLFAQPLTADTGIACGRFHIPPVFIK